jgi:cobyrinic acid a,c-diamide synthase
MIAAPRSGSGKTTVTIALLRAFVRRGFRVRPYKVGPDYLDPSYHLLACGEESYNLDGWMTGDAYVKRHFLETGAGYDLAVVEGVMGLFDGRRGCFRGSSAGIAALLGLPVVLVVDCAGLSGSVAPLVHGFADFEEDVRVAGVILNNVASESHLDYLAAALDRTDAPLVGHVFRDESLRLRHRHLGLVTAGWDEIGEEEIERLSGRVTRHIDLDALLALSGLPGRPGRIRPPPLPRRPGGRPVG